MKTLFLFIAKGAGMGALMAGAVIILIAAPAARAQTQTLSFSQNNLSLSVGLSASITITGGNGSYYVTNNSNPSALSFSISGNIITVSASTSGASSALTVCDNAGNCGVLTVGAGSTSSNTSLSFDSANLSVSAGQTVSVVVSGGSGYFVSNNSNTGAVSHSISGNVLSLSGLQYGSAAITVCSSSSGCGTVNVTVNSSASTTMGPITFSPANPTLTVGQSLNVNFYGNSSGGYFISTNASPNIAQATLNNVTLSLTGQSAGSDQITVCGSTGGCGTLYATVTGQTAATPVVTPAATAGSSSAELLAAIRAMQSQLVQILAQIQTMAGTLTKFAATIALTPTVSTGSVAGVSTATSGSYYFTQFLTIGSEGAEVTDLQRYLAEKGFYTGPITGYFGSMTKAAVAQYQSAHGIDPAGYVGPSTRTALNAGR